MMRSFFGQPLLYHFMVTLCLFLTFSSCAEEKNDEFPRRSKDGKRIFVCKDMEVEYIRKHVYVSRDSSDDIQLKCPVENENFDWEAKYLHSSDQVYRLMYSDSKDSFKYNASGETLEDYALNIGKPTENKSGIFCCRKSDGTRMLPFLSHAVLILPNDPVINLNTSKSKPVKIGDHITLRCSKIDDKLNDTLDGYPKPTIFWEKNSDEISNVNESVYSFKVESERDHNASFKCGWRFDNLENEEDLKPFYSNSFFLEINFSIMDEENSTSNSKRINLNAGDSETLTCVFKANPPLGRDAVTWNRIKCGKGGKERVEEDLSSIGSNDTDSEVKFGLMVEQADELTTIYSLTINNFNITDDVAAYICRLGEEHQRVFNVQDDRFLPPNPTDGQTKKP